MPGHRKNSGVAGRRRRGGATGGGRGRPRGMGVPGNPPVKLPPTVARKKKRK